MMKSTSAPQGRWQSIQSPTLLLDREKAMRNIARMAAKAQANGVRFRPHFKTHQSATIGAWFRATGVQCATVSSVAMADYFVENGWTDLTIAFPVNLREVDRIDHLAARSRLQLLVESTDVVAELQHRLSNPVGVWVEIDTGYERSGLSWDDERALRSVAAAVAAVDKLQLRGVLCHAGHTYHEVGAEAIRAIHDETVARLQRARSSIIGSGAFTDLEISVGDTPACSVLTDFGPVDEIRPGNFVFYDVTQWEIGACTEEEIAIAVACPVVAIYPHRREVILYGGAVHLSKDSLPHPAGGLSFGRVAPLNEDGWGTVCPGAHLRSLSQEHGIVKLDNSAAADGLLGTLAPGDLLAVLPIHSCLTANLLKRYQTLDGEVISMAAIPV